MTIVMKPAPGQFEQGISSLIKGDESKYTVTKFLRMWNEKFSPKQHLILQDMYIPLLRHNLLKIAHNSSP